MFLVVNRSNHKFVYAASQRKDAVYWCKVNQISSLPDGEWEDDYLITSIQEHQEKEARLISLIQEAYELTHELNNMGSNLPSLQTANFCLSRASKSIELNYTNWNDRYYPYELPKGVKSN